MFESIVSSAKAGWSSGSLGNALGNIGKACLIFDVDASQDPNDENAAPEGSYPIQVQYNPASVRFQANAQPMPFKYLQNNVESSIPTQRTRNASVVMSVELIFDDTNIKDAFMADKFRVSASDIASDITALKRKYSVLPQTNAILAALLRDTTRNVTFRWNEMSFSGELTEAQAAYTMFSVSGQPIRSTITINITQEFSRVSGDDYDSSFDVVFGSQTSLKNASAESLSRRTSNLLNFNL